MQISFKYHNVRGFGTLYEYAYNNTHMITKQAKQRLKIIKLIILILKSTVLLI